MIEFVWNRDFQDDDRWWTGKLIEDKKTLDEISISSCDERRLYRVSWCYGWSMTENLSYDDYNINTAKRWCEKWLLERYINSFENTITNLPRLMERANFAKEYLLESTDI